MRFGRGDGALPSSLLSLLSLGLIAAMLLAHLALLRQGQWFDEYFTFSFLRSWGVAGVIIRLRHWGMRPFSETLAYLYCRAVLATGAPLIAPALAASWAILFGFLGACIRPWLRPARPARWALLLGLPMVFLLSGPVGELWYWPLGSIAYLPALGVAAASTVAIAGPGLSRTRDWTWLAAALTVGAFSAEVGMFLTLLLAPILMADLLRPRFQGATVQGSTLEHVRTKWDHPSEKHAHPAKGYSAPGASASAERALRTATAAAQPATMRTASKRAAVVQAAALAVPCLAAAFVLVSLVQGRASTAGEMVQAGTFHRVLPSVEAALPYLLRGLAGIADTQGATMAALASRALLLAACWAALRCAWPAPVARARVLGLLAALAGAALLSLAGALYQFGVLCCERHDSYRHALYVLMVVGTAGLLPRNPGKAGWPAARVAAPALMALACLVLAPPRIAALMAEYRLAHAQLAARKALFRSGNDAGDRLVMDIAPAGPLFQTYHMAPGEYRMAAATPWFVQGPMLFFGKTRMLARMVPAKAGGAVPPPPQTPSFIGPRLNE